MKMIMGAHFKLYRRVGKAEVPVSESDISDMSVGGFNFTVDGKTFPFDFDATSCTWENDVLYYESGQGPFFNDYEITEDLDSDIRDAGLSREEITAEFLSQVSRINEFYVNFLDASQKECDNGSGEYRVELLDITFCDYATSQGYAVPFKVISQYNSDNRMRGILVRSKRLYTPQAFLEAMTGNCYSIPDGVTKFIRSVLRQHKLPVADYPLDCLRIIADIDIHVVLVDVSDFDKNDKWKNEYRWFRVPENFDDGTVTENRKHIHCECGERFDSDDEAITTVHDWIAEGNEEKKVFYYVCPKCGAYCKEEG